MAGSKNYPFRAALYLAACLRLSPGQPFQHKEALALAAAVGVCRRQYTPLPWWQTGHTVTDGLGLLLPAGVAGVAMQTDAALRGQMVQHGLQSVQGIFCPCHKVFVPAGQPAQIETGTAKAHGGLLLRIACLPETGRQDGVQLLMPLQAQLGPCCKPCCFQSRARGRKGGRLHVHTEQTGLWRGV